ncbi:MAG: 4-(cytidine 5'-diphospho)-2-C-methyl-D-erythritol kinase [Candidatus Omnitrophota bacterium]
MVLFSRAKLNLYLEVLNKRKDNYHNIKTVFERIDLSDKIILKPRPDKIINIICADPDVPKDKTNLCCRAAESLRERFNIKTGLDIKIIKRIPVGSGLGGGSSNAAAVLLGLNKLWKLRLCQKKLAGLAGMIGSDVPFFVYNASFGQGNGRGEKIRLLKGIRRAPLWHILVVPKIKVSTPLIYKEWDKQYRKGAGLTKPQYDVNILILALEAKGPSLSSGLLFNSLESLTIRLHPEVRRVKEKLADLGLRKTLMSGSGPAVFGIVPSKKEAVSLSRKLKKEDRSWRIFATRTF